jgi:hypothetical protein
MYFYGGYYDWDLMVEFTRGGVFEWGVQLYICLSEISFIVRNKARVVSK